MPGEHDVKAADAVLDALLLRANRVSFHQLVQLVFDARFCDVLVVKLDDFVEAKAREGVDHKLAVADCAAEVGELFVLVLVDREYQQN